MGSAAFFRNLGNHGGNAAPGAGTTGGAMGVLVELAKLQPTLGRSATAAPPEPLPELTPFPTLIFDDEDSAAEALPPAEPVRADCRAALESLPHLIEKIHGMWGTRGLDTFIHTLLMDSRDGQRQGFSFEAARELMFLAKMNLLVRAIEAAPLLQVSVAEASELLAGGDHMARGHAAAAVDPWGQHLVRKEKSIQR